MAALLKNFFRKNEKILPPPLPFYYMHVGTQGTLPSLKIFASDVYQFDSMHLYYTTRVWEKTWESETFYMEYKFIFFLVSHNLFYRIGYKKLNFFNRAQQLYLL